MTINHSEIILNIYEDASNGNCNDGRSYRGIKIAIGNDSWQHFKALSSNEAQIIALKDVITYVVCIELIFIELREYK